MIIKVCGMREPQNIREVAALAINWIGFIFYERSKRFVERCPTEQQVTDSEQLSPKKVGVFCQRYHRVHDGESLRLQARLSPTSR